MRYSMALFGICVFVLITGCAQQSGPLATDASPQQYQASQVQEQQTPPQEQQQQRDVVVTPPPYDAPNPPEKNSQYDLNQCCMLTPGNCQPVQSGKCTSGARLLACNMPICHR